MLLSRTSFVLSGITLAALVLVRIVNEGQIPIYRKVNKGQIPIYRKVNEGQIPIYRKESPPSQSNTWARSYRINSVEDIAALSGLRASPTRTASHLG